MRVRHKIVQNNIIQTVLSQQNKQTESERRIKLFVLRVLLATAGVQSCFAKQNGKVSKVSPKKKRHLFGNKYRLIQVSNNLQPMTG